MWEMSKLILLIDVPEQVSVSIRFNNAVFVDGLFCCLEKLNRIILAEEK